MIGVGLVCLLIVVAFVLPAVTGWQVKALGQAPLVSRFDPRVGPGTPLALALAVGVGIYGRRLAARLSWTRLLILTTAAAAVWMLALDAVDGPGHLGAILDAPEEYLPAARGLAATGLSTGTADFLAGYSDRIPLPSADPLPVHLAGHPPGTVLVFALLVSLGLKSPFALGLAVTLLAATIPAAVLLTCRTLGTEESGRSVAAFLATAPAAIWAAVSADALIAAVAAWGVFVFASAAVRTSRRGALGLGLLAGLIVGAGTYLSYGFPLIGAVIIGVVIAARQTRGPETGDRSPLGSKGSTTRPRTNGHWWALGAMVVGGLMVAAMVTSLGFAWWEAYPVLQERYWAGFASARPAFYWLWANLAALLCATGPALGAGLAKLVDRPRPGTFSRPHPGTVAGRRVEQHLRGSPVRLLAGSAAAMVVLADLSRMSLAEVERIWLFAVPWLLVSVALVPARSRGWLLWLNLGVGLALAHLTYSAW